MTKLFGLFSSIFDAREATNIGTSLGDLFVRQRGSRRQSEAGEPAQALQALYRRAEEATRNLKLNLYTKAKLANAFKWKLLENGVDKVEADGLSKDLLLRLGFRVPKTPPVPVRSAPRGSTPKDSLLSDGNNHFAARRYEEAITSYRNTIGKSPNDPVAHNNLGAALFELGRLQEAEKCFHAATRLKHDYADAYSNLGNTRREIGKLDEAEQALRKALKIDPKNPNALCNIALTFSLQGRFDEAESYLRKALEIDPNHFSAMIGLGNSMGLNGDFAEAERLYRRALEIRPMDASAWTRLAHLRRMTPADSDWYRAAEKLTQTHLSPTVESGLRFAMGKYCDDTHDFDKAFANYKQANELRKMYSLKYDGPKMAKYVEALLRHYDAALATAATGAGAKSERPVFVVGMMRSGTSLIEQILATHPSVHGAGELTFWSGAAPTEKRLKQPQKIQATEIQKLADQYLTLLSKFSPDSPKVLDKTPGNFMHLGLIHAVFPEARIIHVTRNPLDTCLSIYFQNLGTNHGYVNDLSDLNHYYRLYRQVMSHWHSVLPKEVLLDAPYEDLLTDLEAWSRHMLEFIGLDWDPRCLNFHETKRRVATASNWQVRQKLYSSSAGRWRNYEKHIGPLKELLNQF